MRSESGMPSDRLPTIAEAWQSFRAKVIHPEAGPTQLVEMRRAFYAAASAMHAFYAAASAMQPSVTQEEFGRYLAAQRAELEAFGQDVRAGRA